MRAELHRTEIRRLLRATPFQRFVLTFDGGDRVLIEHPENIAFDPTAGGRLDVSIIGANLRYYSTLDAISTIAMLDNAMPAA
jgi:hypothetical protein